MDKEKETKKKTTSSKSSTSKKKETSTKKKTNEKNTSKKNTKANVNSTKKKDEIRVIEPMSEEYYEYDEDLEVEEEVTKKEEKKKTSKENIKKIEDMAKKKKVSNSGNSKWSNLLDILDNNRHVIYSFIGGVLITILVVIIIWPDRIATLSDGTQPVVTVGDVVYTADDLYENMKNYYSVSLLLDQIDTDLLSELYPEDDEMTDEVESNAEYYLTLYEQYYGYTESEFLEANGFSSYDDFLDYLKLDYRRNQYLDDYVEDNLTDEEIETYYNENVYGDINVQHILIEFSEDEDDEDALTEDEAKELAEEIITKLNDGTSWEQIQEDYADQITFEDLGYQSWDASLEDTFKEALEGMEDNSYSTEPVETSYGYHVIYRLDQKEKDDLEDVKDAIVEDLVAEKEEEDSNLLYKALISLREENGIEFSDTVMKSKYESYCKEYE